MSGRAASVCLILLATALAGCSGKGASPAAESPAVPSADAMAGMTQAQMLGQAPHWAKGQFWDHAWTLGTGAGAAQFDVKSIVVDNATGATLATDNENTAAEHAAFFFHDLGQMDPSWSVHQDKYVFPWYSFPLSDGKTWTAHEENIDGNLQPVSRDLTLKATFINASGSVPAHYLIESLLGNALRARYDYRADLGWFSRLEVYDPTSNLTDPQVTIVTKGTGTNWTGTYHEATADYVLDYFGFTSAAGGQVNGQPQASFTLKASHTHLLAILFTFGAAGAAHLELAAPDGRHWESYAVADQNGASLTAQQPGLVLVPAVAGDWHVALAAASPFAAGGGCFAWGVTLTSGTL